MRSLEIRVIFKLDSWKHIWVVLCACRSDFVLFKLLRHLRLLGLPVGLLNEISLNFVLNNLVLATLANFEESSIKHVSNISNSILLPGKFCLLLIIPSLQLIIGGKPFSDLFLLLFLSLLFFFDLLFRSSPLWFKLHQVAGDSLAHYRKRSQYCIRSYINGI